MTGGAHLRTARPAEAEPKAGARPSSGAELARPQTQFSLPSELAGLGAVVVHFSTRLDDGSWVIELRSAPSADRPIRTAQPGARITLPDGVVLTLVDRYPATGRPASVDDPAAGQRLWRGQPLPAGTVERLLTTAGRPIRYGYLPRQWPLSTYQTVFADPAGPPDSAEASPGRPAEPPASAEMASAGRPFSAELVTRLASHGVLFAPITLAAGVSSLESAEPPLAERFRVPARTAMLVNWTHRVGGRVIAVGTTATRALETAAARDGRVRAADGWTELLLGPDRPARTVDGLITGLHDPNASHLLLLEAVAGPDLVRAAYAEALAERYLWHEFGDSCLLIPDSPGG